MSNRDIAKILKEMAALYEMEGVEFKPRAYERAALGVEAYGRELAQLYKEKRFKGLLEIPGVGKGIAEHVEEYLKKGHFKEYEHLKKKVPAEISELLEIEGIGPRMIKTLWQKLKIRDVEGLEKAAKAGKIAKLEHFGKKSEEKILKGIELLERSRGRHILGLVLPEVRALEKMIQAFPEVDEAIVAGSLRRRKETIGDIDILVTSDRPEQVMARFLKLPQVAHIYSTGKTKTMVKLQNGIDADLRVVPEISFGAALNYFTGSKEHNVYLREVAIKKGYKLNEY
jgi:DNA polymerase (family 10)